MFPSLVFSNSILSVYEVGFFNNRWISSPEPTSKIKSPTSPNFLPDLETMVLPKSSFEYTFSFSVMLCHPHFDYSLFIRKNVYKVCGGDRAIFRNIPKE